MATTVASLRAAHREFAEVDHPTDAEIQAAIDTATDLLDATVLSTLFDAAVDLKACQILASSPFARDMRMEKKDYITLYDELLRSLLEPLGRAWRVAP